MSIKIIKFKDGAQTASKGRNGIINTTGFEIMSSSYGAMVSPITSKGKPSDSCFIEIEHESVGDFIQALKEVKPEQPRQYSERFKKMSEGYYSGATEFEEHFVTAWAVADGGTKKALEAAMPEIFFE